MHLRRLLLLLLLLSAAARVSTAGKIVATGRQKAGGLVRIMGIAFDALDPDTLSCVVHMLSCVGSSMDAMNASCTWIRVSKGFRDAVLHWRAGVSRIEGYENRFQKPSQEVSKQKKYPHNEITAKVVFW